MVRRGPEGRSTEGEVEVASVLHDISERVDPLSGEAFMHP